MGWSSSSEDQGEASLHEVHFEPGEGFSAVWIGYEATTNVQRSEEIGVGIRPEGVLECQNQQGGEE